jgi:hypothetical protein
LSRPSQERVPAALAALAAQAGLAILLFLSLQARRTPQEERESFFILPRPPTLRAPMLIDARRAPARSPPAPAAPAAPAPLYRPPAPGASDRAVLDALGRGLAGPPAAGGGLSAHDAAAPAAPEVKNEDFFAAEREANHTPPRVPCVSLTETGIGMGPIQTKEYSVMVDMGCAIAKLLGRSSQPPPSPPGHAHASEADFQKALAAAQARQRARYARPAPTGGR